MRLTQVQVETKGLAAPITVGRRLMAYLKSYNSTSHYSTRQHFVCCAASLTSPTCRQWHNGTARCGKRSGIWNQLGKVLPTAWDRGTRGIARIFNKEQLQSTKISWWRRAVRHSLSLSLANAGGCSLAPSCSALTRQQMNVPWLPRATLSAEAIVG